MYSKFEGNFYMLILLVMLLFSGQKMTMCQLSIMSTLILSTLFLSTFILSSLYFVNLCFVNFYFVNSVFVNSIFCQLCLCQLCFVNYVLSTQTMIIGSALVCHGLPWSVSGHHGMGWDGMGYTVGKVSPWRSFER